MVTDTSPKTGYWRVNPATGEREWIESSFQPKKPRQADEAEPSGFIPMDELEEIEPLEEVEPAAPEQVSPLISSRELFEIDQAWSDWSRTFSQTGQIPEGPDDEALIPFFEQWKQAVADMQAAQPPLEEVEPVRPGVPTVDVTELAELYGLYSGNFVSPEQLADLALPPEKRVVQWTIPYAQYLTWEQAKYLGFDVPEGSVVKMTPMAEGGPSFTLVAAPEQPVRVAVDLENSLRRGYPEMFDPANSYGFTAEEIPAMVVEQITLRMQDNYQGFVDDLYARVGEYEAEVILRQFGVTEENILLSLDFEKQEERVTEAIQDVFPDFTIKEFGDLLDADFPEFIKELQTGGSSLAKRKLLETMGFKPEEINQIFSRQILVIPVDGVRQSLTVDIETQAAYDERGNYVGSYNKATKEFTKAPRENILKNTWDWTTFQSRTLWEQGENFFLSVMPEIIYSHIPMDKERRSPIEKLFSDDMVRFMNQTNQQQRENFRWLYAQNKDEYNEWVRHHPELLAPVDYQEGAFQHPELLKDPNYYAYEFANIVPFIVTSTVMALATGGIGLPAIIGTAAIMAPVEGQAVYEELINAGAPEDKAASLAAIAGGIIGALESAGRIPLLKQVSPLLFGQFKRKVASELAKKGLFETIKKFGRNFTIIQFSEVVTEVTQEVVGNVAVSFYDENRSILENLPDIAVKTAVATILPAGGGAAVSVRMIGRPQQQGLTDIAKKAKGWIQDEKGNWYEQLRQIVKDERGFVRLPGEPEEIRPSTELLQSLIGATQAKSRESELLKTFSREELDQAHDAGLVTRSPKGIYSILLKGRDFLKAQVTPAEVAPEVVVTEPGAPEAGIQPTFFGEAKVVRPPGKGKVVQISMEDQLKLEQARQAVEEAPPEVHEAYEAQEEITGLEVTHKQDPVAQKRIFIGKDKKGRDQFRGLDFFISLKEQAFPETFTVKQAQSLFPGADFSRFTQPGTPEFNKVPRDAALDDMTREFGMTPDEIADRVMEIRQEKRRVKELNEKIRTQMAEKPLVPSTELTTTEVTENWEIAGRPKLTLKQAQALAGFFGDYVMSETAVTAFDLQRQLQSKTRAERFNDAAVRAEQLMVQEGMTVEDALTQARQELSGELPFVTIEEFQDMSNELRDSLFAIVYHKFSKLGPQYQGEMWGTITALTNAIGAPGERGRAIPRKRGAGSILFPEGGSAWDRLNYVFGKQPKVLKAVEKMAQEAKSIPDVVEGVFHEIGREPIPIDQETADYLRKLSTRPLKQEELGKAASDIVEALRSNEPSKLGEIPSLLSEIPSLPVDTRTPHQKSIDLQNFKLEIRQDVWEEWSPEQFKRIEYLRRLATRPEILLTLIEPRALEPGVTPTRDISPSDIRVKDLRNPADLQFALADQELITQWSEGKITADEFQLKRLEARDEAYPPTPPTKYDTPIDKAFKIPPMFNFMEQSMFNRVLKEILWSPLDIGNFLRANKASFDQSFLRQSKLLLSGHPILAWQAHATAWQSMFSQKHTEAEWELITRDPDFQIYEQIRVDTGHDPLRVPAFAATKGTEQYRTSEEFGFTRQDVERAIPRFTAWLPHVKYSERGFSAGTNKTVWGVWKQKLAFARRYSEKIASGEVKLKEGEAFDIIQEMTDEQSMLGDLIQRANLRQFSGLAPAINAFFFAARSKIGRFLLPKHLLGITIRQGKVGFNPRVMKEAWKDFFLWNSYISGIMFLGAWLNLWDLEKDPHSAEFMSARIGKTRIDPWAGYRQFVVLYARLVTGTGISSVTGAEYDVNKLGALQSFVINSLSPLASIMLEFWTGRNFLGQVIDYDDAKYWIEKVTPFSINDIWEAAEEDWRLGIAVTIPAVYGEGVQTYTGDWEDNFTKLGLPKYIENTAYGLDDPYYDTADFWADTAHQFDTEDLAELTAAKGFPDYIRAIVQARIFKDYLNNLPTDTLVSLNADPSLTEPTFGQYYQMWKDRGKLVAAGNEAELKLSELQPDGKYKVVTYKGEDALKAFDADERTRNANRGNFTQTQFALLNEYWSITDEKKQAEFLKEHKSEIGVKAREEWLRSHPKENAQLAVWGQAKIFTQEAFTEFNRLVGELDIPVNALPELTVPPETSWDTHIDYEEMVSDGTHGSVEADLLLLKDHLDAQEAGVQSYVEWRIEQGKPLTLSDKPLDYLQIRVDNQNLYDALEEAKTITIRAEREAAIEAVRDTKVGDETFRDVERRVDAMGKGTREVPIPPEIVTAFADHMKIVDETSGNSAEAKLNRYDNPELNAYLMSEDYHGKSAAEVLDESKEYLDNYLVPRWRIEVEYKVEDDEYDAFDSDDSEGRDAYLAGEGLEGEALARRLEYGQDRRRREALEMSHSVTGERFPIDQIETFVGYNEIEIKGKRQERFLVDNGGQDPNNLTGFAKAMHDIKGIDIPLPEEVPSAEYDNIYDEWRDDFTRLEGLSDNESRHYIEDTKEREAARQAMRFMSDGKYTAFGLAEVERNGYAKFVPEEFIGAYVGYYKLIGEGKPENWKLNTGTDLWYEDDWFMMDVIAANPENNFYKNVYRDLLGNEKWDFTKVPIREVFDQYLTYIALPHLKAKDDYRDNHRELDAWLVLKFDYTPITEKKRREERSSYERFIEEWYERGKAIEDRLKKLRE